MYRTSYHKGKGIVRKRETRRKTERKESRSESPCHLQSFRNFQVCLDCTFFVARVELGFQIPIAKILFAALDDEGRISRVARHAEDERLGLRRRQLFMHAPSSRFCTSFRKREREENSGSHGALASKHETNQRGNVSCGFEAKTNESGNPILR